MIQLLKKADKFNTTIFNGKLIAKKPVAARTKTAVTP